MPQVNEISWILLSTKIFLTLMLMVFLFSYHFTLNFKKFNFNSLKFYKLFFII